MTNYPAIQWAAKSSSKLLFSSLVKSSIIFRCTYSPNRERLTIKLKLTIRLKALKLNKPLVPVAPGKHNSGALLISVW